MKTKKKLVSICLLALSFTLCMIMAITTLFFNGQTTVYAANATTADASAFRVIDGAAVRTKPDSSGIRYTVFVSKDFYDAHTDGTWGAILGNNGAELSTLTVENAIDAENTSVVDFSSLQGSTVISPVSKGTDYVYYLSIVYPNGEYSSTELATAYADVLNIRAYWKSADGETIVYSADNTDTKRSITQVAERILLDDAFRDEPVYTADNSKTSIIKGYVTGATSVAKIDGLAIAVPASESIVVSGLDEKFNGSDRKLYINGEAIDGVYTVTDGSATLPSSALEGFKVGDTLLFTIELSAGNVVNQQFKYATEVITTKERLQEILAEYVTDKDKKVYAYNSELGLNGGYSGQTAIDTDNMELPYYILGEDITMDNSSYYNTTGTAGAKYPTLVGTLDGNGHKIYMVKAQNAGMFCSLAKNSSLKNLHLQLGTHTASTNAALNSGAIAYYFLGNNKIENVVLNINSLSVPSAATNVFLIANTLNDVTMKDVLVSVKEATGWVEDQHVQLALGWALTKEDCNNVHVILPEKNTGNLANWNRVAAAVAGFNNGSSWNYNNTCKMYYVSGASTTEPVYPGTTESATVTEKYATTLNGITLYQQAEGATLSFPESVGTWTLHDNVLGQLGAQALVSYDTVAATDDKVLDAMGSTLVLPVESMEKAILSYNGEGNATLTGLVVADGSYDITINGASFGTSVAVASGTATVDTSNISGLKLGNIYEMLIGSTKQSVQYVTEVVSTTDRLQAILDYYTIDKNLNVYVYDSTLGLNGAYATAGKTPVDTTVMDLPYYILGADITLADSGNIIETNATVGAKFPVLVGTLDGNGYTVSMDNTGWVGVFGNLAKGSSIKNLHVQVKNHKPSNQKGGVIAKYLLGNNTLENVVVNVNTLNVTSYGHYNLVAHYLNDVNMKDVLVSFKNMSGYSANQTFTMGIGLTLSNTSSFNNVHVVLPEKNEGNLANWNRIAASGNGYYDGKNYGGSYTMYYAKGASLLEKVYPVNSSVTGDVYEVNAESLNGVMVYHNTFEGVPTKIGSWMIDSTSAGTAEFVSYDKTSAFTTGKEYNLSINDLLNLKLFSEQGVFNGTLRYDVVDENVLTVENGALKAVANGTTTVKVAYQINGNVSTLDIKVNVA